jgi:hypothetical protein
MAHAACCSGIVPCASLASSLQSRLQHWLFWRHRSPTPRFAQRGTPPASPSPPANTETTSPAPAAATPRRPTVRVTSSQRRLSMGLVLTPVIHRRPVSAPQLYHLPIAKSMKSAFERASSPHQREQK